MASWAMHMEIGKRVCEKLNFDKDLFNYGNLIPDVDKGTSVSRHDAHFYGDMGFESCPREKMISINKFLGVYQNKLANHMILGYYCHLITDNFFNNNVYSRFWVQDPMKNIIGVKLRNGKVISVDEKDTKNIKKKYKHADFELYGKYLFNENEYYIPQDNGRILHSSGLLEPLFLDQKLIDCRLNYLNQGFKKFNKLSLKEKMFKHKYEMYTKEELDSLMNECATICINELSRVMSFLSK